MSTAEAASLCERLAAGPQRGLGCAREVAAEALERPQVLRSLIDALTDERPLVVARAANALKRIHAADPNALEPFGGKLIRRALSCGVREARWNLLIVIGGLRLRGRDRPLAIDLMLEALGSSSALLRVFAMQALADTAHDDPALQDRVRQVIVRALEDTSAAVRARARKLAKHWCVAT